MIASSPATLQPDPSLTFPVPYSPARIPLSPPPYRSVFLFVNTFSASSSPAISPTTIPTATRLRQRPLATQFPTAPATNWTATGAQHESSERNGRDNNCACPQPFPEANATFPWGPIVWKASNPAVTTRSPAHSADPQFSYVNGSADNSSQHPNPPSQPGRDILLEQWLHQQARFHTCDDFANQTDFVPLEEPSGGGWPGPRQMLPSGVLAALPGRQRSDGSMDWMQSGDEDLRAPY
jgi:hypothetical protein